MGTILLVLAGFVVVLAVAFFLLSVKYEQERHPVSHEDERYYELDAVVTTENVGRIVEYQMLKAGGLMDNDHPAVARRKLGGL